MQTLTRVFIREHVLYLQPCAYTVASEQCALAQCLNTTALLPSVHPVLSHNALLVRLFSTGLVFST